MVRLTRLRIDRFRNVKPGTELHFGPTFNVLLGKNATGKSTLLDLVAAVTNDDLSAYAKEDAGFDLTWWLESDNYKIERKATRTPAKSVALPEGIREDKAFDDDWTIVLRTGGSETWRLDVVGTRAKWTPVGEPAESFDVRAGLADRFAGFWALVALTNRHTRVGMDGPYPPETPTWAGMLAAVAMLNTFNSIDRFDEALNALAAITRSSYEWSHDGRTGSGLYGRWLPRVFVSVVNEPTTSEAPVISFERLGSLAETPTLLGFSSAEVRPRVLARSQDGERVTTHYQGLDFLFRRADGSQLSHELLSFGQKRLFSFLWYLAVRNELPVVADELLNGLHHEWIEVCFDRLRDRQSFLATQHPLLLDHIPIESAEAVRTTFLRCSLEAGPDGREQMVWRNFDKDEAERFFIAYQTGIQHVSEVLRTEGLW